MTAPALTRLDIGARIALLPPEARDRALLHLKQLGPALQRRGARRVAERNLVRLRRYATDPWAYMADRAGITLTKDQSEIVELLMRETRLLLPSANNQGKTFLLGAWAVFRFDCLASLPNEEGGLEEQGAKILLPGPDHPTVYATVYAEMLTIASRCEQRGFLMPGERSDLSVNWKVRAKWDVEAFSPPARTTQEVAHTASGRHHRNMAALIEEGQGVPEPTWRATEGMCSADGNQIVSSFNPTEPVGPAFTRAQQRNYKVRHINGFNHPNVQQRKLIVPDAIDFKVVDARVRADCRDRGPYPATPLDPAFHDFPYALAAADAPESGSRTDGILGHPAAPIRVYRPSGTFTSQVLGQWPAESESGLFNAADVDAAMARWRLAPDPMALPDRVGVDPAREGKDDAVAGPSWGLAADALLRLYAEAETKGEAALIALRATRRLRIGAMTVFPKGDGVDLAINLHKRFPSSPFIVDEGGVGSSPFDHLRRVLNRVCLDVSFAATPLPSVPGEPYCENTRTQLYVRLSMLTRRGLVDLPDDPILREELLAHEVEHTAKTVEKLDTATGRTIKTREPAVALIAKDKIKKKIGRSPDRSDTAVLCAYNRAFEAAGVRQTTFRIR